MTTNFNENHPELKEGEVFLTNSDDRSAIRDQGCSDKSTNYSVIPFSTKRKGTMSYNIHGKSISSTWPDSFPVFVLKSEIDKIGGIEAAIKMLPLSFKPSL